MEASGKVTGINNKATHLALCRFLISFKVQHTFRNHLDTRRRLCPMDVFTTATNTITGIEEVRIALVGESNGRIRLRGGRLRARQTTREMRVREMREDIACITYYSRMLLLYSRSSRGSSPSLTTVKSMTDNCMSMFLGKVFSKTHIAIDENIPIGHHQVYKLLLALTHSRCKGQLGLVLWGRRLG